MKEGRKERERKEREKEREKDQPSQYDETPSLLKIQKLAGVVTGACSPSYLGG